MLVDINVIISKPYYTTVIWKFPLTVPWKWTTCTFFLRNNFRISENQLEMSGESSTGEGHTLCADEGQQQRECNALVLPFGGAILIKFGLALKKYLPPLSALQTRWLV